MKTCQPPVPPTSVHLAEHTFINVSGTAVALLDGLPVAVLERQGKVLRIFQESVTREAIVMLAQSYKQKRIFPLLNRIAIKEYPPPAEEALQAAGFSRQMLDYVMWRL